MYVTRRRKKLLTTIIGHMSWARGNCMELENHRVNERYDVLKSLQSGFYGTAWLSKDRKTGKDVCLKVGVAQRVWYWGWKWPRLICIQTFFKESKTQLKELAILKQLCEGHFAHDNVCKVFDVSLDKAAVTDSRGVCVCVWCLCVRVCACICQCVSIVCCVRVLMHVCVFAWHCNYL